MKKHRKWLFCEEATLEKVANVGCVKESRGLLVLVAETAVLTQVMSLCYLKMLK